jgi:hypothetical protein
MYYIYYYILMSSTFFSLQTLIEEYKSSPYMLSRLETHINQLLPDTLKVEEKKYTDRIERKQRLTDEYTQFIDTFMLKHRYYYCAHSELFLEYDGCHFIGCSVDDILYKILSRISAEKKLMPWKYRTNNDLISKIKQKSPMNVIPESATIQSVIGYFYPALFHSRSEVKYFLTIIGDCICGKKTNHLFYIISPYMKLILQEISYYCTEHFGLGNIFHCFKYKFYDHEYKLCRLVHTKHKNYTEAIPISYDMTRYMIDILCVAAHYSKRYGMSDLYLEQCSDPSLVEYVKSICISTPHKMVESFIEKSLHAGLHVSITTKNMIFLWKKYLEEHDMPNIIFHEQVKQIFREKLTYDEECECFLNVTSRHLPIVSSFMEFWEETITTTNGGNENTSCIYLEYKVDELTTLFRIWLKKHCSDLTEDTVIAFVKHFYPEIEITDNKYIMNIKCSLWDKHTSVSHALEMYKDKNCAQQSSNVLSLYSAYEHYTNHAKYPYIVSKRYFEIVSREECGDVIDEYGIISNNW